MTDIDTLLDMAVEQNVNKVEMRGSSLTAEVATDDLCVEQLLEVREYADGHFEEEHAKTAIKLADKNGVVLSSIDESQSNNSTHTDYGVTLSSTAYYTVRVESIYEQSAFRVNRVTSTITRTNGSAVPVSLEFLAWYDQSIAKTIACSSASSQTHQYTTYDTNFYVTNENLVFQTALDLSNGSYIIADIAIYHK